MTKTETATGGDRTQKYYTTCAYFSGAICGRMWMGGKGAINLHENLGGPFGLFSRFTSPGTWRGAMQLLLNEKGGDFQDSQFTADSVVRVERRYVESPGKYTVHVWEREISQLQNCADMVDSEAYVSDFMNDEEVA